MISTKSKKGCGTVASVLDYVFVNGGLLPNVKSIYIDEGKLITPWRKLTGGKKKY